jgi:hypothetical protein
MRLRLANSKRRETIMNKADPLCVQLPSGCSLEACADCDTEYPGIHITLIHPNGDREIICFAEHNPNKPKGRELHIGAYNASDDEPTYYESYCSSK